MSILLILLSALISFFLWNKTNNAWVIISVSWIVASVIFYITHDDPLSFAAGWGISTSVIGFLVFRCTPYGRKRPKEPLVTHNDDQ
jgi:hypothetical protein